MFLFAKFNDIILHIQTLCDTANKCLMICKIAIIINIRLFELYMNINSEQILYYLQIISKYCKLEPMLAYVV